MYDPTVGRFLEEDPIGIAGGDPNFYRYCSNEPLTKTDPTGLQGKDDKWYPDDDWSPLFPYYGSAPPKMRQPWAPGAQIQPGMPLYPDDPRDDPNDPMVIPPEAQSPQSEGVPPAVGRYSLFKGWWWNKGWIQGKNPFDRDQGEPGWPNQLNGSPEGVVKRDANGIYWLEITDYSTQPPSKSLYRWIPGKKPNEGYWQGLFDPRVPNPFTPPSPPKTFAAVKFEILDSGCA
jgi:uncharacterized protein RhaS with RHS repeats